MNRQHSLSEASIEYYRSPDVRLEISGSEELRNFAAPNTNDRHYCQSRRLPFWLWYIIAKSLGIKLDEHEKPICSTILYTATFMSALAFFLSTWWFTWYDIASSVTKTTAVDGVVSIIFTFLWVALALYANKLAYRLFSHKKFLDMLRLHSKTILKMNASVALFVLILILIIVNDLNAYESFLDETCHKVAVETIVCKIRYISRLIFSCFALLWNYLVSFVLISVCRTHTIGIRKFMQALEQDSRSYEAKFLGVNHKNNKNGVILEECTWLDEDYLEELQEPIESKNDDITSSSRPKSQRDINHGQSLFQRNSASTLSSVICASSSQSIQCPTPPDDINVQIDASHVDNHEPGQDEVDGGGSFTSDINARQEIINKMMTINEILFRYWKVQSRLRLSSVALQRWMLSILSLVVVWLSINLVMWLTYEPTLLDLANFFLPMLLLPLLASAYAEVNQEGQRLLKFICPTEQRLGLLLMMQNAPLQMTVYGFTLSYSTITTAAFGILLAFASKVLIQEIQPGI